MDSPTGPSTTVPASPVPPVPATDDTPDSNPCTPPGMDPNSHEACALRAKRIDKAKKKASKTKTQHEQASTSSKK